MTISRDDVLAWIQAYASAVSASAAELVRLDAAIGDGDHGANLERGFQAVLAKLPDVADRDVGTIFKTVATMLISTVGGASGPLYGTFFLRLGVAAAGKSVLTLADWAVALQSGVEGVIARGKAAAGDKTMVDALVPALDALKKSVGANASFADALRASAEAARAGMTATIPLVARKGRASYLGERSAGHQDPGATSAYLLLKTAAECWT